MDVISFGRSFSIINRRAQLFFVAACENLGLSYSGYLLLMRLYAVEGASQDQLAEMLSFDKAMVTRTIALLEEKDFVRREKDGKDRRVRRVYLTEKGRAQQRYLQGFLEEWVTHISQGLHEEELQLFMRWMKVIADTVCASNLIELSTEIQQKLEKKNVVTEV